MRRIQACAIVLRLIFACSMPGRCRSPAYRARPVALPGTSGRRWLSPITEKSFISIRLNQGQTRDRPCLRVVAKHLRRVLDRLDNLRVAGAAADIAGDAEADLGLGR